MEGGSRMENITLDIEEKNPEKKVKILKQYLDLLKENKEKE